MRLCCVGFGTQSLLEEILLARGCVFEIRVLSRGVEVRFSVETTVSRRGVGLVSRFLRSGTLQPGGHGLKLEHQLYRYL